MAVSTIVLATAVAASVAAIQKTKAKKDETESDADKTAEDRRVAADKLKKATTASAAARGKQLGGSSGGLGKTTLLGGG